MIDVLLGNIGKQRIIFIGSQDNVKAGVILPVSEWKAELGWEVKSASVGGWEERANTLEELRIKISRKINRAI